MKQVYLCCTILFSAFILTSCVKEIKQPSTQRTASSINLRSIQNAKPGSLARISLNVSIQDNYTDGLGNTVLYKIKSDGNQYSDGIDYVSAYIDEYGNFIFKTNTSKNSLPKRFVLYDLSDPVDPNNTYSPGFGRGYYYQYNYNFTTSYSQFGTTPFQPLQLLNLNQQECISMTGNIDGDGVNSIFKYTVRFHATKDDLSGNPTAFAIVTRTSENQWKIEPASCDVPNNIGDLWTGDNRNEITKGYFHLPFSFILSKK
jgi:hypothetical protein